MCSMTVHALLDSQKVALMVSYSHARLGESHRAMAIILLLLIVIMLLAGSHGPASHYSHG
jgi:hypothetical protein